MEKKQWLIFKLPVKSLNDDQFNSLNDRLNKALGFPNKTGTERYAQPVIGPDGIQVAICICGSAEAALTDAEKLLLVDALPEEWAAE